MRFCERIDLRNIWEMIQLCIRERYRSCESKGSLTRGWKHVNDSTYLQFKSKKKAFAAQR